MFNARPLLGFCTLCAVSSFPAKGDVLVYYDRAAWEAAVASRGLTLANFPFTPSNLALSDELASPPAPDVLFGPMLTFSSSETQLPFSFVLSTVAPDTSMMLWSTYGPDALGVDSTTSPFDDGRDAWEAQLTGAPVLAFGFDLIDNDLNVGESVVAYGIADAVLGSVAAPTSPPESPVDDARFVGIIADGSILRVLMDEAPGDEDNTGMKDLTFAVAKIPTVSEWGVLIMGLATLSAGTLVLLRSRALGSQTSATSASVG